MEQRYKAIFTLPAVRFAPFLAAGMLLAYFAGSVFVWIIPAAAISAIVAAIKKNKLSACFAGLSAGLLLMTLHVNFYCKPILSYAGETVRAEFTVGEILGGSGSRTVFVGKMNIDGLSANVRLSGERLFEEGSVCEATISLDKADEQYLTQNLAKEILLSGEVEEFHSVQPANPSFFTVIGTVRRELSAALRENVQGESGEIAMAILFGRDEFLSQTFSEQTKISGIAHYTAVSGAHFSILAAVLLGLVPRNRRKLKSVLSVFTAVAAVVFFGATASVMRASAMFIITAAAPLFRRSSETLNTLCLAVSALLLISPGAVLDIGFAMSVLGVFGAGVLSPKISEKLCQLLPDKAKFLSAAVKALSASFCALVCTAPISVAVFKGVSLCAVLTSILVMPLMAVGMMFLLLLGVTGAGVLAVPIDLAMRLVSVIVKFFGQARGLFLSLDFAGAWVLAAVCAVLLTVAAFGTIKTMRRCLEGTAVAALMSMLISLYTVENRREMRFVGNSNTSAAIAFHGREAVVFVSGNGSGLADDISRCLRERGAVKIAVLAAFETDYGGALSLKELTEMVETGEIFTSEIAQNVLKSAKIVENPARLSLNGITIACAKAGDRETAADFVLFHGSSKRTENSAKTAIYFANSARALPENAVNIRANRDFSAPLDGEEVRVKIEKLS